MSMLTRLLSDRAGAMTIETALVAPILLTLSLGGVEAGSMVARQSELQSAAAEALNIVQAAPPENQGDFDDIRDVLVASTGLDADNVAVEEIWRCGTTTNFERTQASNCGSSAVSSYIQISLEETYQPSWTEFGIGGPLTFNVVRQVQIG